MKNWSYDKWKLEVQFRLDLSVYCLQKGIELQKDENINFI